MRNDSTQMAADHASSMGRSSEHRFSCDHFPKPLTSGDIKRVRRILADLAIKPDENGMIEIPFHNLQNRVPTLEEALKRALKTPCHG